MAFFDQMFGGGGMAPGMGGSSPSAFTSPGMSPQLLGLLMGLQNHAALPGMGGGFGLPGGPQMPMPPAGLGAGGAIPRPGMPALPPGATAGGPQQSNLLQMIMGMNPQMLRALLSGGGVPAAGGVAAPGLAPGIPNSGLAGGP